MTATTTRVSLKRCDPISLDGRYASQTAPDLERTLRESIDAGVFRIVLDMGKVANVNNQVRQVFELAGILPLIQHFGG